MQDFIGSKLLDQKMTWVELGIYEISTQLIAHFGIKSKVHRENL